MSRIDSPAPGDEPVTDPGASAGQAPTASNSTDGDPDAGVPAAEDPAAEEATGRRGRPLRRWLLFGGVTLVVIVVITVGAVSYGVFRLGARTSDRHEAETRVRAACGALETRLNRLAPPGATTGPDERATAIRYENVALEPLLTELTAVTAKSRRYEPFRTGWQRLVAAREQFARDLDAQAQTGRPAFFVPPRDGEGRSEVVQVYRLGPDSCDAAARRLAAPDL